MTHCFISYDSSDRVAVESLVNDIRKHGHTVWIDLDNILGGAKWEGEITKAIQDADVCLVTVTPDSIQSEWVKKELIIARALHKPAIPLVMRQVSMPEGLKTLGIEDLQYIDVVRYGYNTGFQKLLDTLAALHPRTDISLRTLRVLIIEDVPAQQAALRQVLESLGLETTLAGNFDTALEAVRREKFDLVTLDMQLDEMDANGQHGILLLNQMGIYQRKTPVIIISALEWSGKQVRDFLRKYEAFDYLKKPFDPEELTTIVKNALKQKDQEA